LQFLDAMMQQRSNTATRVRKMAGPTIFDCKAGDLDDSGKRSEKFRGKIGWLSGTNGKGRYDHWAVEIFHDNYHGKFDINGIFRNPILLRVCCIFVLL
jgi:hypothetical protein